MHKQAMMVMVAGALAACDAAEDTPTETYHEALRPLVEAQCVSCHQAGGIAPFSMTYDAEEWASGPPPWAAAAVDAVESGRMPPWSPDPACREYKNQRVLTPDERAVFTAWRDADYAEGDVTAFVVSEAATAEVGPPDLELAMGAGYVPDLSRPDDYRCLPLPQTFERDTWITRTDFRPDRAEMVHHVVLFVIPPSNVGRMEQLDRDDDGPGYTCFGDSGIDTAKFLAVWAPGLQASPTPKGSALLVPAGGRIVMQMHYNVVNLAGRPPEPDRTSVNLWTLAEDEAPEHRLTLVPHADFFLDIAAGDGDVENERIFDVPDAGEIVGVVPHEHLLGTAIRADLLRDGEPDACLVDIPSWDFNWQDMYYFREGEALEVRKGDRVRLNCRYDNSPEAQPVFNGERVTPRDVGWGDGTFDEMCLNFLVVKTPYERPFNECAMVGECQAECEPGDHVCWIRCTSNGGGDCAACTIPAWIGCSAAPCGPIVNELLGCALNDACASGVCLLNECADITSRLHACSAEHMRAGHCNTAFAACGFQL